MGNGRGERGFFFFSFPSFFSPTPLLRSVKGERSYRGGATVWKASKLKPGALEMAREGRPGVSVSVLSSSEAFRGSERKLKR